MFVGCFEISISVIVKHVQSIEIIRVFFVCLGGQEKLLGFGLLGGGEGDQYPGCHYAMTLPALGCLTNCSGFISISSKPNEAEWQSSMY